MKPRDETQKGGLLAAHFVLTQGRESAPKAIGA